MKNRNGRAKKKRGTYPKHKGLTGYRLHLRRFAYSGKTGMRSIKFPVTYGDESKDREFAEHIISGYNAQVGALNISTWLAARKQETGTYSLLDFWLDSLRAGVIFAPSVARLREKLIKVGARIVRHGRYVVFQLAEVAVPRALFAAILRRIDRLRPRPPPGPA